uniref:Dipeptidylpeptidase IV N-terminal domain-containing protein n=1 Tax=Labrus bergylta TaxID=56723 RepID=A0A3Q3H0A4_9LABR
WDGDVLKADIHNNETQLLLKNTTFATFKASKFAVSPDLNFVLLGYDVKCNVYYFLEVRELNPPEVSDSVLQFASWGVQGQQLVYIFENNIYYKTDVQSSSWRLTSSGQEGLVFNGITDWLYEEEVLHTQTAHWWSPDGSRLAYLNINDTLVPSMLLPRFTGALYPRGKEYSYPKMGQINPSVRLYVVTVDGSSITTELRPPDSFEKSEYYITMVKWVTKERLSVRWVNRAQNMSILSLCDVTTSECTKKHVMTSEKWLDRQSEEPAFSKDCSTFFITMPLKHGGHGTFNHITMISNQFLPPTLLLFSSHRVFTVDPFQKECLTCSLFKSKCAYYDTIFSPNYQNVILNCRGNTAASPRQQNHCYSVMGLAWHNNSYFFLSVSDSAPSGQAVSDRFSLNWESVLVSSDSVIVARLDGRGSGFQVFFFLKRIQLINDQVKTLYLCKTLSLFPSSQIFPDEGHNIASTKSQHYMLNAVLTFFRRCFEEELVVVPQTSKEDE